MRLIFSHALDGGVWYFCNQNNHVITQKQRSKMAATRLNKGWNRAVSRKFYASVCKQIHAVSALSDDIRVEHLLRCLDEYIDKGSVDSDFTDIETVVFTLLQPLIDKAVERSRRARQRAALRKKSKQGVSADIPSVAVDDICTDSADSQSDTYTAGDAAEEVCGLASYVRDEPASNVASNQPLSREEKRDMRREAARKRRIEKHEKRLRRRHPTSVDA